MAKQLNIDLNFRADTSKAKQSINELQQYIQKLGYSTMPKDIVNPEAFKQAAASARELSYHLQNAYNSKTGNLDLSKLSSSLKSSNTNLTDLTKNFSSAGQVGQQAFVSLAKTIAAADQPSLSLNTHLSTLWTTLKNVARFQLTSSIIHGLVGGVQNALHYAQDLNTSLNNIRIVTGQSVDQMATFAKEANNAARALSTSTLKYTDAALIYYQQGLSDKEVKERTDVTVKLANVTKQSAEEVSSQLTAIWNNFDDGTKSLEYYADVITKLGASTASSSDEIAEGLSKFASVADTVGLSYEKATAALATVVAETRQSADVVGTAFKTMFARFQGLSLGETLEDGVDLNKYSKALKTVGVEVLETNGELRRMDDILNDTYSRWNDISEAQRVALAETVAGTRQYAQFMALMNNYGKILSNQQLAANSTGTLQDQADIYAESWEAAKDRVKAAAESVYDALIDENFFIKVNKVTESALGGISKFIENFGGVKAILETVFSFALSMLSSKIEPAIQKIIQDIQILSGGANKVYTKMQNEFTQITQAETNKYKTDEALRASNSKQYVNNLEYNAELTASNQLLLAKTKLSAVNDKLSASEKMRAQVAISGFELQAEQIEETIQQIKKLQQEVDKSAEKMSKSETLVKKRKTILADAEADQRNAKIGVKVSTSKSNISDALGTSIAAAKANLNISDTNQEIQNLINNIERSTGAVAKFKERVSDAFLSSKDEAVAFGQRFSQIFTSIGDGDITQDQLKEKQNQLKFLQQTFKDLFKDVEGGSANIEKAFKGVFQASSVDEFKSSLSNLGKVLAESKVPAEKFASVLKKLGVNENSINNFISATEKLRKAKEDLSKAEAEAGVNSEAYKTALNKVKAAEAELQQQQEGLNTSINNFNPVHTITALEGMTKAAALAGQAVTIYRSINSAIQTLGDKSASAGEQISALLMAFSMTIPAVTSAYSNFKQILAGVTAAVQSQAIVRTANIASLDAEKAAIVQNILSKNAEKIASGEVSAAALLEKAGIDKVTASEIEQQITNGTLVISNKGLKFSFEEVAAAAWASLGPYALIAVALGALIGIIAAVVKEYNKYNVAAEQASQAAKELAQDSENAANKLQEIKQAFDGYDATVKTLKDCTQGTKEWKEALQEVNEEVLTILEKHPELASEIEMTKKNGYLEVLNANEIIDKAEKAANDASIAAIFGNVDKEKAYYDIEKHKAEDYIPMLENKISGDISNNTFAYDQLKNPIEWLNKTPEEFELLQEQLQMTDDEFKNFKEVLQSLGEQSKKLEKTIGIASDAIVEKVLGDDYEQEIKNIESSKLDKIQEDIVKQVKSVGKDFTRWAGKDNDKVIKLMERYTAATGKTLQLTNNAVQGSKEARAFEYYDDETGEKKLITLNKLAEEIATGEAKKQITENAKKNQELLYNLDKNVSEYAPYTSENIRDFFTNGNFENSNWNAINAISKLTPEELLAKFGLKDADEFKEVFNVSIEHFYDMANEALDAFTHIGETLSRIPKSIYQDSDITNQISNLTLAEQREIIDSFQQVYNKLGPTATKEYSEILKSLGDEGSKFGKIFANFDFTSGTTEKFIQALKDAGIDTSNLSDEIHHLADEMTHASGAALGLAEITGNHKEMNDIVGKLKTGGSISEEDYKKLFNQNAGFADFFQKNINGEYDLLSTPEAVQAFMDQTTQQQIDKSFNILEQGKNNTNLTANAYNATRLESGNIQSSAFADYDLLRQQLDFLNAAGKGNQDWETAYQNGNMTVAQTLAISDAIQELQANESEYNQVIKEKNELNGTMATSLAHLSQLEQDQKINQDGVTAGLKKLGGQYESTIPLVQKLTQLEKEGKKGSDEYKKASHELWQEIRKQEWAEVIGNIEKHVKALADEKSSNEELRKAYIAIAKEFNDKFKLGLTPEQVAAHKKQFIDLANADADQINDIALSIESVLGLEQANLTDVMWQLGNEHMTLKEYIESNPIQVDAEGNADMTGLLSGLELSEEKADELARILEAVGQTRVTVDGALYTNAKDAANAIIKGYLQSSGVVPKVRGTGARDYTQKIGGGSGGGGGNKDKKNEIDRYHEELAVIKDLQREYDRLGKAKDRAWGANQLAYIDAEIDKTKDLIAAQDKYLQAIKTNLQTDYDAALGVAQALGIPDYGDMNWTEVQTALEQSRRDKKISDETYTERKKLLDQYIETLNLLKDEETKFLDLVYQAQDQIQEKLTKQIDLRLELKANDLQKIEYALKKIGDNAFKRVEALSNLFSTDTSKDTKTSTLVKSLQDYNQEYEEIQRLHQTPLYTAEELQQKKEKEGLSDDAVEVLRQQMQMSDADYIENLKRVKDGIYDDLNALQDLRQEMREYYSDTLAKGQEEIDKLTNSLAHQSEVLEHLKEVFELTGDALDYDVIGAILTTGVDVAKDEQDAAIAEFKMYEQQVKERQEALNNAVGEEAIEIAKHNLEVAQQYMTDAENKMYDKTKAYLERIKALAKNEADKTKKAIDDVFTDGLGWDYINKSMELSEKTADKYLTKTNQVYETNKLLRDIAKDIDKTTSQNAKAQLSDFSKRIAQLQQVESLSKNTLEIMKQQYTVLQAQIALKEAQDAKSTVRLQRDSAGNYGYVYTADQDQVREAEQALEDAENGLYNLVREQENDTAKEIMEINQQKTQELYDLWVKYYVDKTITAEEYNNQSVMIEEKYSKLLEATTKDHLLARELLQSESVTKLNDTWTAEFDELVAKGQSHLLATDEFWQETFGVVISGSQAVFDAANPKWSEFLTGLETTTRNTKTTIDGYMSDLKKAMVGEDGTEGYMGKIKDGADALGKALGAEDDESLAHFVTGLKEKFDELDENGADPSKPQTYLDNIKTKADELTIALAGDGKDGSGGLIKAIGDQNTEVGNAVDKWSALYDKLTGDDGVITAAERTTIAIHDLLEEANKTVTTTIVVETKYVTSGTPTTPPTVDPTGYTGAGDGDDDAENPTSHGYYVIDYYGNKKSERYDYADDADEFLSAIQNSGVELNSAGQYVILYNGEPIPVQTDTYNTWADAEQALQRLKTKYYTVKYFDTGGYTGSWAGGSDLYGGKLAMLHEKEIVLNQEDTKNLLASVSIIRELAQAIDLRAAASSLSSGLYSPMFEAGSQALEQTVTIHAEFPNATDRSEIEAAFESLVNQATQYAHANRR